jgi:hypothetical protein
VPCVLPPAHHTIPQISLNYIRAVPHPRGGTVRLVHPRRETSRPRECDL